MICYSTLLVIIVYMGSMLASYNSMLYRVTSNSHTFDGLWTSQFVKHLVECARSTVYKPGLTLTLALVLRVSMTNGWILGFKSDEPITRNNCEPQQELHCIPRTRNGAGSFTPPSYFSFELHCCSIKTFGGKKESATLGRPFLHPGVAGQIIWVEEIKQNFAGMLGYNSNFVTGREKFTRVCWDFSMFSDRWG